MVKALISENVRQAFKDLPNLKKAVDELGKAQVIDEKALQPVRGGEPFPFGKKCTRSQRPLVAIVALLGRFVNSLSSFNDMCWILKQGGLPGKATCTANWEWSTDTESSEEIPRPLDSPFQVPWDPNCLLDEKIKWLFLGPQFFIASELTDIVLRSSFDLESSDITDCCSRRIFCFLFYGFIGTSAFLFRLRAKSSNTTTRYRAELSSNITCVTFGNGWRLSLKIKMCSR